MDIKIERAGDDDVEVQLSSFPRGGDEVGTRHCSEFGAEENRGPPLLIPFHVATFCADPLAGHGESEVKAIRSSLCACWTPAVLRLSTTVCAKSGVPSSATSKVSIRLSSASTASTLCGDKLSTVNGPETRMRE